MSKLKQIECFLCYGVAEFLCDKCDKPICPDHRAIVNNFDLCEECYQHIKEFKYSVIRYLNPKYWNNESLRENLFDKNYGIIFGNYKTKKEAEDKINYLNKIYSENPNRDVISTAIIEYNILTDETLNKYIKENLK